MKPLFHVTLPPLDEYSEESHFAPLVILLEGLIKLNRHHIRQSLRRAELGLGPPIPPLYESGVYYKEDPAGEENWCDVYECLKQGTADCDRMVGWRCAELQEAGIAAEPVIKWQHLAKDIAVRVGFPANAISPEGLWLVHCCVRWPSGLSSYPPIVGHDLIEDPSKLLGMGGGYTSRV